MRKLKKVSRIVSAFMIFTMVFMFGVVESNAYSTIGDNYDLGSAYNYGYWKYAKTNTCELLEGENSAFFRFNVRDGERIYASCTKDSSYKGMKFILKDESGRTIMDEVNTVADNSSFVKIMAVRANGGRFNNYVLEVQRGTYKGNMYFTVDFENRMKEGSKKFNIRGIARNAGNRPYSSRGRNSSEIEVDLTRDSSIPQGAIVKRVSTSSYQSPSQGGVHHMIRPEQSRDWFVSRVASSNSGMYRVSEVDNLLVAQNWLFRYNATAGGRSSMSNVKLDIRYEYDITSDWY
ncbi:hypothetical protein WG909_11180 [Peptostreptococcaceae bacterium AGR-M142]